MDQLLPGEVSVGAQLVYYNLVFRLDKSDILDSTVTFPSSRPHFFEALIEAIEGLVELPGDALYLEVHVGQAVAGPALRLGLASVHPRQLVPPAPVPAQLRHMGYPLQSLELQTNHRIGSFTALDGGAHLAREMGWLS